nr:hypothetical protein [Leptospira alexanderi]
MNGSDLGFLFVIIGEDDGASIGLSQLDSISLKNFRTAIWVRFDLYTIRMKKQVVNSVENGRKFSFTMKTGF